MQQNAGSIDAEELVDGASINKFHILVWALGASVIFIDGYNIQVMGYLMPQLVKAWSIPHELIGYIVSSGLFGVFTGYLVLSPFASRIGHRTMLIWCTILVGVGTIATSFTHDAYSMMVLRYLTGIALGASNPSAVLTISEFIPKRRRSTFVAGGIVGVSLGTMVAGLVARAVMESYGWQGVLWVGGLVPLALVVVLFALVPNTIDYYINYRKDQAAARALARRISPSTPISDSTIMTMGRPGETASVAQLFANGRWIGTLAIWGSFFANLLVYFFVQSWLSLIIKASGHTDIVAISATTWLTFGGVLAIVGIGPLMDRFPPFKVLSVYFVLGGCSMALLGFLLSSPVWVIYSAAFLVGFTVLGVQKGMNAICVYFYPGAMRATGLGWGLGIGRLGAVAGPIVAGWMQEAHLPTTSLFYYSALPMIGGAICMVIVAIAGRANQHSNAGEIVRQRA